MMEINIRSIAESYIADQLSQRLITQDMRKYVYSFQSMRRHPNPAEKWWSVVFEVRTPEGSKVDGPTVVIVDEVSGKAKFLE